MTVTQTLEKIIVPFQLVALQTTAGRVKKWSADLQKLEALTGNQKQEVVLWEEEFLKAYSGPWEDDQHRIYASTDFCYLVCEILGYAFVTKHDALFIQSKELLESLLPANVQAGHFLMRYEKSNRKRKKVELLMKLERKAEELKALVQQEAKAKEQATCLDFKVQVNALQKGNQSLMTKMNEQMQRVVDVEQSLQNSAEVARIFDALGEQQQRVGVASSETAYLLQQLTQRKIQ